MITRRIALGTAVALVAGCTAAPPAAPPLPIPVPPPEVITRPYPRAEVPPAPVPLVEPGAIARALDYVNRTRQRSPRDQRIEVETARKAFAATRSEHDRIRLALLLSLPHSAYGDDNQALELLEPLARDAASEYHGLAQFLAALLNEQRRLERQSTALQQKLDRIRALEKEMQRRAATPESKKR